MKNKDNIGTTPQVADIKYNIGYVDEDPKQVALLERRLRTHFNITGYQISKGLSLKKLLQQIYASKIDLLMVDFLMVDKGVLTYNGDKVAREYEKLKPRFPILIFTNQQTDAFDAVDNPNIIYDKAAANKNTDHFVEVITKNIKLYQDYVGQREGVIKKLNSKKGRLTALEKHELLQAQQDLNSLDRVNVQVPLQLVRKADELSAINKEVKAFVNSLIKRKKSEKV